MKTCSRCKIEKESKCFSKCKEKKSGLQSHCKKCISDKYENNKKFNLEKRKEYKRTTKSKFINAKYAVNREWTLTFEEYSYLVSKNCFYCDNLLDKKVETGSGLDRMDNSKGYTFDNCVSCCNFCNAVKSNKLTSDEMQLVAKLLIEKRKS